MNTIHLVNEGHNQESVTTVRQAKADQARWWQVLRAVRTAQGVTQERWAIRLGVSVATVRRWESGLAVPNADAEAAIIRYCQEQTSFRTYDHGPLRGLTLTPVVLRDVLAEARLATARDRPPVAPPLAPPPSRTPPPDEAPGHPGAVGWPRRAIGPVIGGALVVIIATVGLAHCHFRAGQRWCGSRRQAPQPSPRSQGRPPKADGPPMPSLPPWQHRLAARTGTPEAGTADKR